MVGPNTMLASSQWIKRNMMGDYSEKLDRPLTEAEIRVKRCIERLPVPDWYRNHSKSVKFLKNDTPIESRPPTWRAMKGRARSPRETPSKQHVPEKVQAKPMPSPRKAKPMPSPRKSLNSNYRIARKADNLRKDDRLSISISPSSSDNESPLANFKLSPRLSRSLNGSHHTFPRVQPSRKIQNINIVLPKDFTPKPPRQSNNDISLPVGNTSTPRTHYTLTKSIEVQDLGDSDAHSVDSQQTLGQSSHTSFLFAEVRPGGVTTRVHVFAGMDSDESEDGPPASPHARFFNSRNKSSELERIVQSGARHKRGDNSLIRDIIGELDRSIAESAARRNDSSGSNSSGSEFVKSMVRALEQEDDEEEGEEVDYSSDSDLAKSTSISFKSLDDELASSSSCGDEGEEEETTPLPTYDYEKEEEEEEEEEVYWIPSKIHELPRTSSRLSVLSRGSNRSGFQCTSGRCSPGLSPIKSDRARDEWTATPVSYRSHKSATSSRQLFRIDESQPLVADSGCYSDRTASRTPNYCNEARIYSSASSSAASSPTLEHLDGITTEMLIDICGRHQFSAHNSIAV